MEEKNNQNTEKKNTGKEKEITWKATWKIIGERKRIK